MAWRAPYGPAFRTPGPPWTPASLPDLTTWVQPSGIVGTGAALVWTDDSPVALDYVVGNEGGGGGGAPTVAVLTNGLNGVVFDGVADAVQSGGSCSRDIFLNDDQFHVFMVAQQLGDGGANTGLTTPNNPCFWEAFAAQWGLYCRTVAGVDTDQWMNSLDAGPLDQPGVRTPSVFELWLTTDGVGHFKLNGGVEVTMPVWGPVTPADGPLSFAYSMGLPAFFNCHIGEFFVSATALGPADQALAEAYITTKWGLPA